jgi:hypothetical protein
VTVSFHIEKYDGYGPTWAVVDSDSGEVWTFFYDLADAEQFVAEREQA